MDWIDTRFQLGRYYFSKTCCCQILELGIRQIDDFYHKVAGSNLVKVLIGKADRHG